MSESLASTGTGTSTRVAGTSKVSYPGWGSFAHHIVWHFRGSLLAALVCVFGTCSEYGLPALLRILRHSTVYEGFLQTNAVTKYLQEKFFDGRTDGKTLEDALLFVMLTIGVHALLYTCLNGFFFFCDCTGFLSKYKLPRTPRMKLPPGIVWQTIREAFVNQLVTGPAAVFLIYVFVADFRSLYMFPGSDAMTPRPQLLQTWYHMAMASLCNEVFFYFAHRAFHEVPGLYTRFHKQHHRYVGSIGFAAEYAHPIEQIVANQFPTACYMLFCSRECGMALWVTWLAWRLWETYEAHSGYCFSGSLLSKFGFTYGERAKFHDWHHSDNRGCYGVYWLDYLFGTMDSYAQLQARGGHPKKQE